MSFASSVISTVVSKLKGEEFRLSAGIPASSILALSFRRLRDLLRGAIKCTGTSKGFLPLVFAGKNVTLINKSFIRIGKSVTLARGVYLDGMSGEGLEIGDNVSLGPFVSIECTGSIRHLGKGCKIGDRTGIGGHSFIGAAGGVSIGNDVIMGQYVSFHSENHNFDDLNTPIRLQGVNHKGIIIEDDCWIGSKATFLDGARVGRGSVIGAGSVVRGDIPPYSVAAGVPAKVIRNRKIAR
ncbi:Putative acetyltransferase [Anaerolineae bacterium]|nr:Putative acetyltransferase [Anaerolineae bacterium]